LKKTINFLKYRPIATTFSISLIILFSVGLFFKEGFNLGIDFIGGTKIIAQFKPGIDEKQIRLALDEFKPMVQQIGEEAKNEFIISTKITTDLFPTPTKTNLNEANSKKETKESKKLKEKSTENSNKDKKDQKDNNHNKNLEETKTKLDIEAEKTNQDIEKIKTILSKKFKGVNFLSVESVGPAIGNFLKKSASKLFIIAIILMTFYLTFRFEFRFSIGAMVALFHDILLSVLFCGALGIEINIPVIAALLTIFGYSVNDTIVIFDRIRENSHQPTKRTLLETINRSISQSFTRTLLTSITTLLTVLALYLIGGEVLNEFALILLFGIFIGTYSSIYIASPALIIWEKIASKK